MFVADAADSADCIFGPATDPITLLLARPPRLKTHDLALGQMPMAYQPRPAISSQLVGAVAEKACNLGLRSVRQQRSRATAQSLSTDRSKSLDEL
jgi:hypothetical protein